WRKVERGRCSAQIATLGEQDRCDVVGSYATVKEEVEHSGLRKELFHVGESDLGQIDLEQERQRRARRGFRASRARRQARPLDARGQVRTPANPTAAHLRRFGLLRVLWYETD